MSKWIDKKKAEMFVNKKKKEEVNNPDGFVGGYAKKYPNPEKGTQTKSKDYKVRFVPDKKGEFYLEYFYHFVTIGDKSRYVLCEKTFGNDKFCPLCAAGMKLWKGSQNDKSKASEIRKKQRFVGNIYVVDDPRDADAPDDDKLNGSIRLYEFPSTVEMKVKDEIKDEVEGRGIQIFDPENGYDFIIKVFSKPPDKNGKLWPDYSSSKFSVHPSEIPDVDKVMSQVYDLNEYIQKLRIPMEEHKTILEELMIFEDIEDEYNKQVLNQNVSKKVKDDVDKSFEEPKTENKLDEDALKEAEKNFGKKEEKALDSKEKVKEETKKESSDDEDILNELNDLMND